MTFDPPATELELSARLAFAQLWERSELRTYQQFARNEMNVRLWKQQRAVMQAVERGDKEIAVKSGHGIGKTFLAAFIVCYWLRTGGPGTIVVTSAPTNRQVEQLLWREIHNLWYRSPHLASIGTPMQRKVEITRTWAAYGFMTNEPDRFQGWHAPRLRFLIDEANSFPEEIWRIIDTCLTGGDTQLVAFGNPITPAGRFFRSFQDPDVTRFTISSREHPNVLAKREIIRGAVTQEWLNRFLQRHGHDESVVQARIDGEFPTNITDGILSLAALERARTVEVRTSWPVVFAIDVARFGSSETVVTRMAGQLLVEQIAWSKASTMDTAHRIADMIREHAPDFVVVDDDGIGGGVTDRLSEMAFEVVAFRGGLRALDGDRFVNRTTEAWCALKEMVDASMLSLTGGFDVETLWGQLMTRRLKAHGPKARIEPKDEYTRRTGLGSPDHADSLAMACWQLAQVWASPGAYAHA